MINFKSKKILIWDFDGTIVDLKVDWKSMKNTLISEILSPRFPLFYRLMPISLMISRINPDKREVYLNIIKRFEKNAGYQVNEDALKVIKFYRLDKQMYILSDNLNSTIKAILNSLGIGEYFSDIIAKDNVNTPKPSNEGLLSLLKKNNIKDKDKVVVIGDSWKDNIIAYRCGIDFFHVRRLEEWKRN